MRIEPIAHIHTDFGSKFGIPRQSGVADKLEGRIVFCPEYRNEDALRGLEGFTYIWLLWDFSEAHRSKQTSSNDENQQTDNEPLTWSPTVRPPRLGGNTRMGVFATRSPFRPNNIGLSSVKLTRIDLHTSEGPIIYVSGADLMDGTPIYDIKPYLPYTDAHPEAKGGFTDELEQNIPLLEVSIPEERAKLFTTKQLEALRQILAADPRPHYQQDSSRVYGMTFAGIEVKFCVQGNKVSVL